jgi:hypothetical protein
MDADVLVVDPALVDESFWDDLRHAGADCEVRRGESDDPFRAVIRVNASDSHPVDVLIGRYAWQRDLISRAQPTSFSGTKVPVVGAADLVLLKLFAGGPQDLVDVDRLLRVPERDVLVADIDSRIGALPAGCRAHWEKLKATLT